MTIDVSPTNPSPTHHFALSDKFKTRIGLLACAPDGTHKDLFDASLYIKSPVLTTALKQTTGSSSYDIFDYPYSPIVQDDLSGGRANLDFERDGTKYYDSFRTLSGRQNKAIAGPLEQYTSGLRSQEQNLPGSEDWLQLTGDKCHIYKRFQAGSSFTMGKGWIHVRRKSTPREMTIKVYSDSAGNLNAQLATVAVPYTRMNDTLSEWLNETLSATITSGSYYWLVIITDSRDNDKAHWKLAIKEASGSTYHSQTFSTTAAALTPSEFDLYFRGTDADTAKTCLPYEYKEQQYFCVSSASGAPKLYMAGDRGAADSNAGQLNKLIDASKTWITNEHAGKVVMITDGTGKLEPQPWRTVVSNTATELICDTDWTIPHDTTTEYAVLGDKQTEITGHGLTAPVTSILVSTTGVIYFCMGDSVTVRRMREYNNAGTWTREYADETAATKAVHMVYKPQAQKIVISNNADASGNVSCATSSNASIPAWGTALTWVAAVPIDSKYRRINSLICYPDGGGSEAVWVMKTDIPFILPASGGNPYPVSIDEMRTVRSPSNGVNPLRYGVYLIFPLLQGLQQYYGGQFTDMGPNLGEGLPSNRRGSIVAMQGYPGKFFIAIDAGSSGYSSVMDSGGWHERYRAPLSQRILAMTFQVTPGTALDRLWLYQGNDLIWLPFPSSSTNELEDSNYPYTSEFAVEFSRFHAGLYDAQKIISTIKLQTDRLEIDQSNNERAICWFELDHKTDEDADWNTVDDIFNTSPTQAIDFKKDYGLAGKRIKIRLRGYTRDASKTPVFLAMIIMAVIRVDVKSFYGPFIALLEDDPKVEGLRETDKEYTALEKLKIIEDWCDASNKSLLYLESVSDLCHGVMVFANLGTRQQIRFRRNDGNKLNDAAYTVSLTFQEA